MTLALIHLDPRPGLHILQVALGQLQVVAKGLHGKVDIAGSGIGMAVVDQALDNGDDIVDMVGCLGFDGGTQHPQPVHVLVKGGNVAIRDGAVITAFLVGPVDDLVVDVGIVADIGHLIPAKTQVAVDHVKDDPGPGMADVAEVVDRHAADIHAHLAWYAGNKRFFFTGKGIIQT